MLAYTSEYTVGVPKDPVTIRVDREVLASVRELAADREWTPSYFMSRAIERVVQAELDAKRAKAGRR